MKRIYRTDTGTFLISLLFTIFFLVGTYFSLYIFKDTSFWRKMGFIMLSLFNIIFLFDLLKDKLIITDDSISIKMLFFRPKTMKFEEIGEVFHTFSFFPEAQGICFKSKNDSKKVISISVGFGFPWYALRDIMEKLPKDAIVRFEPELWKRIEKPLTEEKIKKINIISAIVIVFILLWFCYFLWCTFKLSRIPFPVNILFGRGKI